MGNNNAEQTVQFLYKMRKSHQFTGIPIKADFSYITIDQEGYIAFIVKTSESISYSFATDFLSLNLSNNCQVEVANELYIGRYHILKCNTNDSELNKMFVMLCYAIGNQLVSGKNSDEVIVFFNGLIQLFKTTPAPNLAMERQGLWGELFVLKEIGDIPRFIKYWHSEPYRKFDYSCHNFRVEVKTTVNRERIHSFSHNQLYREDDLDIVVVSLLLQEEDAGISLKHLIEEVRSQILADATQLIKLEKAIKKAGMSNTNEIGPIYDYGYALSYSAWYSSTHVPKFNQAEPKGVSNTYYKIDLSTSLNMTSDEKQLWLSNWN